MLMQKKLYGGCKPNKLSNPAKLGAINSSHLFHCRLWCSLQSMYFNVIAAGGAPTHAGHQHEVQLRAPDGQHALQARPHQPRDRLDSLRAGEGNVTQ